MKKSILLAATFTLAVALPVVLHSSKALSAVPVQELTAATKLPSRPSTPEFDSNKYYRLTSLLIGKDKSLNVPDSVEEKSVNFANSEANLKGEMGQYWKIEKLSGGYYRIKPCLRRFKKEGIDLSLDIDPDNVSEDSLGMKRTKDDPGQAWKIEKLSNGYYRLTNKLFGAGKSLSILDIEIPDVGVTRNIQLAPTGEVASQYWMITEIPIPAKPTTPKPTTPKPTTRKPTVPKPTVPRQTAPAPSAPPTPPAPPTGAALTVEQQAAQSFRSNAAFDKPIDAEKPDYALISAAVYFVTNEARVKQGKSAVPHHPRLTNAAFDYAREMVTKDFFSHDHPSDPAQRTPTDRGKLAGIKNASLAENIAISFGIQYEAGKPVYTMDATKGIFSYVSPEGPPIPMHTYRSLAKALVDQWMNSPGHRANILSDNNRSFGCGVYFFRDRGSDNMLKVKAVQKFQWFKDVEQ